MSRYIQKSMPKTGIKDNFRKKLKMVNAPDNKTKVRNKISCRPTLFKACKSSLILCLNPKINVA